jgi:signal transduction histidine kinase/ActR/RegA family two-component response regulator/HPt (histidine-containing phosphotransfer) domain-containing protein
MDDPFLSMPTNDATLADLRLENVRLAPEAPGKVLRDLFEDRKQLAGVLVVEGTRLVGLISRDMFLRQLTRPFGREVYACRSVRVLLAEAQLEPWRLPSSLSVQEAAHRMLRRPNELLYEPLVVDFEDGDFRLLSIPSLLLAQSQLLALANDTIVRQKEAAMAASRAKGQFLANISHEIRTPMNGILGLTKLVLETGLTAEQREYLGLVQDSAEWLMSVINDVLDFSKMEAERLELASSPLGLREMLDRALKPLALRAAAASLRLTWQVATDVPNRLLGDPVRLRQVLVNLVGNAIKFTERGEVETRVESVQAGPQQVVLQFSVRDTGIGIPPEKHEAIFRPFEQADGSNNRRYGGTGLGLSISSRLVQMMGGQMWVESVVGGGSTFRFTARFGLDNSPLASDPGTVVGPEEGTSDVPAAHAWGLRILLAEDNLVNQTLTARLLEKRGHEVTIVGDGQGAVTALQQQVFDVVLMDVQMPVLDGMEATRLIRSQGAEQARRTPIIALTAHALSGACEQCLEAGMDGFVTKPVSAEELYQAIDAVLERRGQLGAPRAPVRQDGNLPKSDVPSWDWSKCLAGFGGNEGLFREVAAAFLAEEPVLSRGLVDAIGAGNAVQLRHFAHSLKGTLGLFPVPRGRELAIQLEQLGKSGDIAAASPLHQELVNELGRLRHALERRLRP